MGAGRWLEAGGAAWFGKSVDRGGSSVTAVGEALGRAVLAQQHWLCRQREVCCYPLDPHLILFGVILGCVM